MRLSVIALFAALLLDGCGVETSQPAAVSDTEGWGRLDSASTTDSPAASTTAP